MKREQQEGSPRKKKKTWLWVVIAVVVIAIVYNIGKGSSGKTAATTKTAAKTSQTSAESAAGETTAAAIETMEVTTAEETTAAVTTVEETTTEATTAEPTAKTLGVGMYKIGSDLDAGEYVLIAPKTSVYYQIASDSSGDLSSILANGNPNGRQYITVEDGQYLTIGGGKLYTLADAPAVAESGNLPAGEYKVGTDIAAGEYKISVTGSSCYIEVSTDSTGQLSSIRTNDNVTADTYITVNDGEYLTITDGEIVRD